MVRSRTDIMKEVLFAVCMFLVIRSAVSKKTDECPAKQEMSCDRLRTTDGYTYPVLLNIPESRDCEHAWYLLNGTCIAHSESAGKGNGLLVAVTVNNMTLSTCKDLQWELHCDSIKFHCIINYTVTEPGEQKEDNHTAGLPGWGSALIVIGIGIVGALIAVWFYCQKKGKGSEVV